MTRSAQSGACRAFRSALPSGRIKPSLGRGAAGAGPHSATPRTRDRAGLEAKLRSRHWRSSPVFPGGPLLPPPAARAARPPAPQAGPRRGSRGAGLPAPERTQDGATRQRREGIPQDCGAGWRGGYATSLIRGLRRHRPAGFWPWPPVMARHHGATWGKLLRSVRSSAQCGDAGLGADLARRWGGWWCGGQVR